MLKKKKTCALNELSGRTNGGGDKPPPPPSPLLTPFPSLFPIPSVASSYPFPPFYFCVLLLTLIHSFSISRSFHFAPPPSSFFDVIFIRPYLLPSSSSCIFPISPCVLLASSVYSFFLPFSTFSLSLAFTFSFYFCFPSRLSSPPSYSFPFPSLFPTFPCLLLFLLPSFFLNFPLFPPLLPPSSPFSLLPLLALSPSL